MKENISKIETFLKITIAGTPIDNYEDVTEFKKQLVQAIEMGDLEINLAKVNGKVEKGEIKKVLSVECTLKPIF
jgi:hypothetical protein